MFSIAAAGCTDDPVYIEPIDPTGAKLVLEANAPGSMSNMANAFIDLPIRLEEMDETVERAEAEALLGTMIPYVTRNDLDISIEWTIRNLDDTEGVARVHVNGANEYFNYVPLNFVVDPEEEETPPPLLGDRPLVIPALSTMTGVFREDEMREVALDLELITRAEDNPFRTFTVQDDGVMTEFTEVLTGVVIPEEFMAGMIRVDLTLIANRHMVMDVPIRVRDHRDPDLVHEELYDAMPGELVTFAPVDFMPVLTPP
jgi:hypothetical protein